MMQTQVIAATHSHIEHDEETFHTLLDLEHRRCMQGGNTFHVLFCRLSTSDGAQFPMTVSVKRGLVSAMRESLGETNHQMGWFLQDLVLGALLLSVKGRQSIVSPSSGWNRVRRHIERRFASTHPSLVVQIYDFLDLPRVRGDVQVRTVTVPW